ncbi:MAG: diguanylate cyclase [Deltaproteobacteria bacterium]|jgi:diguanylate cyclase (GGDEF)-like protein|nr:diguanylate cyclase [Deltaproteobacteria bacterium]MBW2533462.1 diguanylate cyclase [Deltaproteobacteria bacterium]
MSDPQLSAPPDSSRFDDEPSSKPRLLVVEDEPALAKAVVRLFDKHYEVARAGDGVEGLEVALRLEPDVVLADQRMPRMTGVQLLCELRQKLPSAIRVLMTGFDDHEPMVDAVNLADVHHYVQKPFRPHDLRKVVDMLVANARLESQRELLLQELRRSVEQLEQANRQLLNKEAHLTELVAARTADLERSNEQLRDANERLREMAVRDGLTNLFNHRYLMEHIELEVARSARYGRVFCVLFADIDDFKRVNDDHGHQAGDDVLRTVAALLQEGTERLRGSDVSARYGGEEFCMVLPETDRAGGAHKAERIRQAVQSLDWSTCGLPVGTRVTISIGVAAFPADGTTADDLLRAADSALYRAKRSGKDRVICADASAGEPPG